MSEAWDPQSADPQPQLIKFTAIWDTGATGTTITENVINACGLKPTGVAQVHHADGVSTKETFLVNVGLPNGVGFVSLRVTSGKLPPGNDVLIGMDIIGSGDFAVTNFDGRTQFTYRVPSQKHIDFVQSAQRQTKKGFPAGTKNKPKRPKRRKNYGKNK